MALSAACLPAAAGTFQLLPNADFEGSGLAAAERRQAEADFADAAAFWERHVTGYAATDDFLQGISVEVDFAPLDGQSGRLAETRIPFVYRDELVSTGTVYASDAVITFDRDDVSDVIAAGEIFGIAIHELAHAIGFGLLWDAEGLLDPVSGDYVGAAGLARYRQEFAPGAASVPVENATADPTSDRVHWSEAWAGGENALMTPFLDHPLVVSDTTLLSFRDLGYTTLDGVLNPMPELERWNAEGGAAMAAIPLPATPALLASALAMLVWRGRRRAAA